VFAVIDVTYGRVAQNVEYLFDEVTGAKHDNAAFCVPKGIDNSGIQISSLEHNMQVCMKLQEHRCASCGMIPDTSTSWSACCMHSSHWTVVSCYSCSTYSMYKLCSCCWKWVLRSILQLTTEAWCSVTSLSLPNVTDGWWSILHTEFDFDCSVNLFLGPYELLPKLSGGLLFTVCFRTVTPTWVHTIGSVAHSVGTARVGLMPSILAIMCII
jgi:hypothetical protein